MAYTIEAHDLRKSYGSVAVLTGLDLRVEPGSVFALLGPNGAGKTTTVRILSTLAKADGGRAAVCGHDVATASARVRSSISLTGQYAAVDEMLTGRENLALMARLRHVRRRAARLRTDGLLDRFDLTEAADRRVATYSGGMRRRLDLAMSLVSNPPVLFLDEPTAGLDPRSRRGVWDAVTGLKESGVTVLLTTQYLEEADRLADRVAVLDEGRVIAEGTAEELKARVGTETVELFFADVEVLGKAAVVIEDASVDLERLSLRVAGDGSAACVKALLDRVDDVERLDLHRPTLDEAFLTLTEDSGMTDSIALIGRSLRHSVRSVDALLAAVLLPVMLLLLFVYVFGGAIQSGTRYLDYVVPGIILLCAGFGSATTAVSVNVDMTTGVMDRFRSLPIAGAAPLTGHVVASVVRNLVSTVLVLAVALAIGFEPTAGVAEWLGVLGVLAAFMFAVAWLAAAFGLLARSAEAAGAFSFLILFLPYVSSAFVPPETMPAGVEAVAEHQPLTPIVETLRSLMLGTPGGDALLALGWCLGFAAIGCAAAALLFRRRSG